MKIEKTFQLSWNMVTHSKLRSWLTIIGIVIGIASVLSILAISATAQKGMSEGFGGSGVDIITVSPGSYGALDFDEENGISTPSGREPKNLTKNDISIIRGLPNIKEVTGTVSAYESIEFMSKKSSTSITGIEPQSWNEMNKDRIVSGRYLTPSDTNSILIGESMKEDTFNNIGLNMQVKIKDTPFTIVGIIEDEYGIMMPIKKVRDLSDDIGIEEFGEIKIQIEDVDKSNETTNLIENKLMSSRGILRKEDKDFSISSMKNFLESIQKVTGGIAMFLSLIAGISLLVGAVGITNSMFTSVLEKTKEIGIMKAIGAQDSDILGIFLLNAGMIGLVGGLGGVLIGWGLLSILSMIVAESGAPTITLPLNLIVGSLLFSTLIGMISGAIPAYRASRLNPVDALRYE